MFLNSIVFDIPIEVIRGYLKHAANMLIDFNCLSLNNFHKLFLFRHISSPRQLQRSDAIESSGKDSSDESSDTKDTMLRHNHHLGKLMSFLI